MTDNKYTNEDIISSLKIIATTRNCNECKIRNCKWGTCNCEQITANSALYLIQDLQERYEETQTENENLKVENQSLRSAANSLKMHYEEAQAEIERLQKEVNLVSILYQDLQERTDEIKVEAYKEFAEKLKEYATQGFWETDAYVGTEQIDNLVKEMIKE